MNTAILILLGLNLTLTGYLAYKLTKLHIVAIKLKKETLNNSWTYRQIQAYTDLVRLVDTKWPLPQLRGWAASPDFLKIIATHVLKNKPQLIVECGSGASTIVLARCCQKSGTGKIISLDHDEKYAEKTRKDIEQQGLTEFVTVLYAPPKHYSEINNQPWYSLDDKSLFKQGIDMLVVDGPPASLAPMARYPALPLLKAYLTPHAYIFMDDAVRKQEKAIINRWQEEFPSLQSKGLIAEKGCVMLQQG